ncbi:MAG TPA: glycosyltransferase family A protein [Methanobacterium sp.]|nr:glycosyltransferase family A protein [Methanobacterium sp.]
MIKENEVDVIIRNYNHEDFIKETIESVLNQNYKNIKKIIIADDGSKDDSQEIIRSYAHKHPKIEPILAKENKGIAYNTNRALKRIESEYVAMLDGDDLMFPGKIEKQVEYLNKNPDVATCAHDMDVYNSSTRRSIGTFNEIINYKKFDEKLGMEYRFDHAILLSPSSYMIRRDAFPKHGLDTRLKFLFELIIDVEILRKGKVGYIDEVLGMYRIHDHNISRSNDRDRIGLEEYLMAYSILIARYPDLIDHVKKGKSNIYFAKIMRCIMKGNKTRAKDLSKVLIAEGNYTKGIIAYLMSIIMTSDLINKFYQSKHQNKITKMFYRTF